MKGTGYAGPTCDDEEVGSANIAVMQLMTLMCAAAITLLM
jgi:hypothetical protein